MWGFSYQSIFSDRTFMEVRYTGWTTNDDFLSQTGSTEGAYIDYSPPGGGPATYSGGVWYPWTYDTSDQPVERLGLHISPTTSWPATTTSSSGSRRAAATTPARTSPRQTAPTTTITPTTTTAHLPYDYYYKVDGLPYWYGDESTSVGVFVDDSWTVTDRLTFNIGLRYDYHKGIIPSYDRLDDNGDPTGDKVPGVDPVFTWNNFSPRIGFAYAAGADQQDASFAAPSGSTTTATSPATGTRPRRSSRRSIYSTGRLVGWALEEPQGVWWDPGDLTDVNPT